MTRVIVPFLDANILDVTVVKWLKAPGDPVAEKEVLAEVSTDKAAFEIESPASGTLLAILAPEKSIVPVKYVLGLIGAPGEEDPAVSADNAAVLAAYRAAATPTVSASPAPSASAIPPPASAPGGEQPLRATPKARRYAQANGIDLADVAKETGASMITEAILMQYAEAHK